jgi:hypothetical protein
MASFAHLRPETQFALQQAYIRSLYFRDKINKEQLANISMHACLALSSPGIQELLNLKLLTIENLLMISAPAYLALRDNQIREQLIQGQLSVKTILELTPETAATLLQLPPHAHPNKEGESSNLSKDEVASAQANAFTSSKKTVASPSRATSSHYFSFTGTQPAQASSASKEIKVSPTLTIPFN